MSSALDARLIAAHEAGDKAALVTLYQQAAETTTNQRAHWFYLTHAYVFALDCGAPQAAQLHALLKAAGREA